MALVLEMVKNIAGNGENAGYQHFLLFQQYFLPYQSEIIILLRLNLLSADALNLIHSQNLSFCKGKSF